MKKHHPYDNVIEGKLAQLSAAETDLLWNDMHAILDKKMPQKKERRPFVAWFLSTQGFLVANFLFLAIIGSTLFFISTKEDSTVTQTQVDSTAQFNRIIDPITRKGSQHERGTTIAANDSRQKSVSVISSKTFSSGAVDYIVNNGIAKPRSTKQLQKYMLQDQRNEESQDISIARADIDMITVKPKSMDQEMLSTNKKNEEKDSLRKQPEPVANNKKPNPNKNNQKGFYTGIISGIDLSSIHFRSAKPGSTKGFIIGYAFNKKWSIESGLFWDTKRIHDNGSYFNPPGYTPSSGVTITAVNGKSRLYELPVNVKYTIMTRKHNLFATTGLSSYLMRSEDYDYEYMQNNQPAGHNYLSYKNGSKNWFSVVNFSMGYSYQLGKAGSLRVEPYIKLPVKNIGTANMPIMSTGLNIGFTKPIK